MKKIALISFTVCLLVMGCSHPKTTNLFGIYKPKGMPGTQGPGNRVAIYGLEFTNGYVNVTTIDGDEKASFTVSGKYLTIAVPINVAANVGCLPTAITICPPGTEVIPGHPTGEVQQEVFTIKDDGCLDGGDGLFGYFCPTALYH